MEKQIRRVIFTCGGTAGHVNPAIAVAQLVAEKNPGVEILFVGADRGLEKELVPAAGYDFRTVHISSFHRSFKPAEIKHNLVSLYNMVRSPAEARAILRDFRPDVVIGTGGYASYPMVKAAAKAGIPTAVHESNAVPRLTTGLLEPTRKVPPSGLARLTKAVAILPLAPGLLSTMTLASMRFSSSRATMRASMSLVPPGA